MVDLRSLLKLTDDNYNGDEVVFNTSSSSYFFAVIVIFSKQRRILFESPDEAFECLWRYNLPMDVVNYEEFMKSTHLPTHLMTSLTTVDLWES